jgi:predicted dithiol-disulfide oxidoreductase (DUF899 family)
MGITFIGESPEYRAARDRLLNEEIGLRRQMEAVAVARRALPPGGLVPEDYAFDGVSSTGELFSFKLSELFTPGTKSLAIYSMMFPRDPGDDRPGPVEGESARLPLLEGPCPSCVALLDQLNGMVDHVSVHMSFVVVAKAPVERILMFAKERGWQKLRFVSSAKNSYNRDYHAETPEGFQRPMLNVFSLEGDRVRHFWGSEMFYAPADPGQDPRHVGTLEPSWNLFDLTREGRGANWDEQIQYGATTACKHC